MKKILTFVFLIFITCVYGQCAMCKAVSEQGVDQETVGSGINSGIIFMVVIAYVCLISFLIIAFRKKLFLFWKELKNAGK